MLNHNKMPMKFILGQAGTGKTYLLRETIELLNGCIVFCYTHSGVDNIRFNNTHTFHSYFNLDFNNHCRKIKPVREHNILIDEIGIVPVKIFKIICKFESTHNIICYGDLLQLSPIEQPKTKYYPVLQLDLPPCDIARVYDKLNQTLYSNPMYKKSQKLILTHNYRADDSVMLKLDHALKGQILLSENIGELIRDGYVIISSRYKHLKYINETYTLHDQYGYLMSKVGLVRTNQKFRLCKNFSKTFTNNMIVEYVDGALVVGTNEDRKHLLINTEEKLDIVPLNFITIHKAQGLEFDKVLIVLDDLFDVSMLYTMITRAKKDVLFCCVSRNSEKVFENIETMNKCFEVFRSICYVTS